MISVVIPVYNREHLVKRTLDSVAAQTLAPDKVILVDNNSTDGTRAVLDGWAAGRDNVEVIGCATPGAAAARNAGLALVESDYVMFFDSDDYMPPRHVEQVSAALAGENPPPIVAFDIVYVNLAGKELLKRYRKGDVLFNHIFHAVLTTQRCAVSTALLRTVGGWNESLRGWDDMEFGVKLLMACSDVVYVRLERPVMVHAQAESITGTKFSDKAGEWERALDACEHALAGSGYAALIDWRRAILAGMYMREGHRELAMPLLKNFKMKLIARYVALGGRGVAELARLSGWRACARSRRE